MNTNFFKPKSIAVIGASTDKKKLGFQIVKNLKESGFKGRIYPINNKATEDTFILDLKVYKEVKDIYEVPQLCIISIPSEFVFEELVKCYSQDIKNYVIITAGFKEIGNNETEKFINHFLELHPDVNLLGPNCLGFIDTSTPINASFAASTPKEGKISFFSQSGALCTAVLDWSEKLGMGFEKFVSLGNKNNISENTFLDQSFLNNNPSFFYLESFVNGKEFVKKAQQVKSPIIVLHPGRHTETANAMQSHTGSMAGSDKVVEEALKEAGVIRAYGLEDIMDLMMIFNFYPQYRKVQNVAIVSNAGGPGIITTDSIKDYGLSMAVLSQDTRSLLEQKLPKTANTHNPIDVVGDALADRYGFALDTVLSDSNVDAVIVLLTPQSMTQIDLTSEYIQRLSKLHNKVVIASFMGGKRVDKYEQYLFSYGVPYFDYPERAVWALSKLNKKPILSSTSKLDLFNNNLSPLDCLKNIFRTPKEITIDNEDILKTFCEDRKIALKLISENLWHKSDSGAVKLGLDSFEKRVESLNELKELGENMKVENPDFTYNIIGQEMMKLDFELFLGVKRDISFGNVVAFGLGGIYANILDENMIFLEFANTDFILEKLKKSKVGKILQGARGQKGIDLKIIVNAIIDMHKFLNTYINVEDVDINPLAISEGEIYAIDIKIKST